MLNYKPAIIIFIFVLLIAAGCSNSAFDQVTTPASNENIPFLMNGSDEVNHNRSTLGTWTVDFNLKTLDAVMRPDRDGMVHFDITYFIPAPGIKVNSFDPVNEIIDVDFTISNPYTFDGYDVRLIIHTDAAGHMLVNADNWTSLFDKSGGLPINPFKAFAKSETNRIFAGQTQHTENLLVKLPGGNPSVSFAVDASFPGNCIEPYEISNFTQDLLEDFTGSWAYVEVTVKDWQNNVNAVSLYCPEVAGSSIVSFTNVAGDQWRAALYNNTGASQGEYTGYLIATSTNSGSLPLYDKVNITVTKAGAIDPVGNVTLTVNRNAVNHEIISSNPWTLSWNAVDGAQEYAIYYDWEPSNPDYFMLVDVVDATTYTFNAPSDHMSPNGWVKGTKYIVRARAVAGDPSSESENSEFAYVMCSRLDSLPYLMTMNNTEPSREGWVTAVERTPYAESTAISYWPFVTTASSVSDPNSLSLLPTYLGDVWTVDTGENSDNYPGHLLAITVKTPTIEDSSIRRIDFIASCLGTWDLSDEGGVIIGASNAPLQPSDGWDGTDFRWGKADGPAGGYQSYNWRHSSASHPFPFKMEDYVPPENNCWRWQSG